MKILNTIFDGDFFCVKPSENITATAKHPTPHKRRSALVHVLDAAGNDLTDEFFAAGADIAA